MDSKILSRLHILKKTSKYTFLEVIFKFEKYVWECTFWNILKRSFKLQNSESISGLHFFFCIKCPPHICIFIFFAHSSPLSLILNCIYATRVPTMFCSHQRRCSHRHGQRPNSLELTLTIYLAGGSTCNTISRWSHGSLIAIHCSNMKPSLRASTS